LAHRRAREAKVARAMAELGDDLDALLPRVYDDVHPALHAAARRSLLAHVLKLKREAR